MTAPAARVLHRVDRGVAHLTLNRSEALNALSLDMIDSLSAALEGWRTDDDVAVVLLSGAGGRGLCAGGDVRSLHEQIRAGEDAAVRAFFHREYALNATIHEYPKPFVALADGITMGGGVGLAGHAAVRIVTERSKLAMPETRIGLTPDVGGSWLAAHAPGRLGEYIALTGATMDAADAIAAGFADVFVPSDRLPALEAALSEAALAANARAGAMALDRASTAALVAGFAEDPGPASFDTDRSWIDDAFSANTVSEILARLRARPEAEASVCATTLEELSPTSLAVSLAAVRRARELPYLRAALEQEYGLVMWFASSQPDLLEGIRAQLIDKDRSPHWQPATLDALPADLAEVALAYRPSVPLWS